MPMQLIIRFAKKENLRYISHLDVLRTMQRALRRAEIPTVFSRGFNPHAVISFAVASPVGMGSIAEYAQIGVERVSEDAEFRLAAVMPVGIEVIRCIHVNDDFPQLMSIVCASEYSAQFPNLVTDLGAKVADFLHKDECFVLKRSKSGERMVDIKPMVRQIFSADVSDEMRFQLDCGSAGNLNAELFVKTLIGEQQSSVKIDRTELFVKKKNNDVLLPFEFAKEFEVYLEHSK